MKKMIVAAPLLLWACGPQRNQNFDTSNSSDRQASVNAVEPSPAVNETAATAANESATATAPKPRTSLPEPKGPIDPKSVEAAGQVVQHYGALIEQNRIAEANALWGDKEAAADFAKQLRPSTHLEIGDLGPAEGAAGSIYTTMPVVFYRENVRRPADIILRRVNDVPGSTEAQRRWHIERIDWKAGA